MHAIEVKHLSKDFGILQAATDVSFTLDRGDVLGFLGPNEAGKSTAMKMIAGFLEPSAGTVTVCGHDVVERPVAVKSKMGYLPEGAPRALHVVTIEVLHQLGVLKRPLAKVLIPYRRVSLPNARGVETGEVMPVFKLS